MGARCVLRLAQPIANDPGLLLGVLHLTRQVYGAVRYTPRQRTLAQDLTFCDVAGRPRQTSAGEDQRGGFVGLVQRDAPVKAVNGIAPFGCGATLVVVYIAQHTAKNHDRVSLGLSGGAEPDGILFNPAHEMVRGIRVGREEQERDGQPSKQPPLQPYA